MSMLRRLVVVSALAFAIALIYQPHGWVVFVGLAALPAADHEHGVRWA